MSTHKNNDALPPAASGMPPKHKNQKIDLELLKRVRNLKYQLKKNLSIIDLGKTKQVTIRMFEVEAFKLGIILTNSDMDQLLRKFSDQKSPMHVQYDEAIKALTPLLKSDGQIKWNIQANPIYHTLNQPDTPANQRLNKATSFSSSARKSSLGLASPHRSREGSLYSENRSNSKISIKDGGEHQHQYRHHTHGRSETREDNNNTIQKEGKEQRSKDLLKRLYKMTPKVSDNEWIRDLSCASKDLVIQKNKQFQKYIKASNMNCFDGVEKERIRKFLKSNGIDMKNLSDIRSCFLTCDTHNAGHVSKSDLVSRLVHKNFHYPEEFFQSFIDVIRTNKDDHSSDPLLSYNKLRAVIDVFNACPARFRGDTLNSDNIKNSIENIADLRHIARDKTEKIFRYVHMRLEEKFKDYRRAFRGFDTNYDGTLSFKEFMNGLENLGIRLDIKEFRSIYETLDYDKQGTIDFNKFCLLNTNRSLDYRQMIRELKEKEQSSFQNSTHTTSQPTKPPLYQSSMTPLLKGRDEVKYTTYKMQNIPKNKDVNKFNTDVQELSHSEFCKKKRRTQEGSSHHEQQTLINVPYGWNSKTDERHDMVAIIGNQYVYEKEHFNEDGELKGFKSSVDIKPLRVPYKNVKINKAVQLRDEAIHERYQTLQTPPESRALRSQSLPKSQRKRGAPFQSIRL